MKEQKQSTQLSIEEKAASIDKKFGTDFSGEPDECINFYFSCMEKGMDLLDVDEYAMLNTLFGYDIGFENASKLNRELWEQDIETLELREGDADLKLVKRIADSIGITLDFSKWRTEPIESYSYF